MKLLVLNGPNINMLGIREKEIYGNKTYENLCDLINEHAKRNNIEIEIFQSNHEGDLIDKIQMAFFEKVDGIIINAGAYTHTSIALLDALKATNIKTVEVHISNVNEREDFRKFSYISLYASYKIIGQGFEGYISAINYFLK